MPPSRQNTFLAHTAAASGSKGSTARSRRASTNKGIDGKKTEMNGVALAPAGRAGADIEEFGPPAWRSVLNSRADLGYPDVYPSRPGFHQPEDVLTEENVKNGFVAKSFVTVAAESFSMHGPIHSYLLNGGMEMIMRMGQEIIEKRDEGMPQIGERTFRIPDRVTYNDTRRIQFFADLANPSVPLHRMARDNKAPRDFKGFELLETMFARPPSNKPGMTTTAPTSTDPIPVDRAVWFIRVLGSHEIAAHRQRVQAVPSTAASSPMPVTPNSTAVASAITPQVVLLSNDWYTQEFTNMFTSWLRTQLAQLVLPAKGPTVPVKAGPGVLGDEKSRNRWLAKWSYSSSLLRELHTRRLISTRTLMGWTADYLRMTNLAQLGFVVQLIGDYLPDMLNHVSTARICIRGACEKTKEIQASPAVDTLTKVQNMLDRIIQSLIKGNAEVLLGPSTWRQHSELLIPHISADLASEMAQRNEALLYVPASSSTSSPRRNQIEEKLDSISAETSMVDLCKSFFDGASSPQSPNLDLVKFEEKVFILLNWAMGLNHLGIHRPYGCHTILRLWTEQRAEFLGRPFDIFPQLYNWLDTSPAAKKERNIQAIGITFGEFTRQGMFSYSRYLHILIARGYTARSRPNGPRSHHMDLLRSMPIFVVAKDLLQQRRIALSGDDVEVRQRDDAEEEEAMEAFKEECKEYVPEIYGYKRYSRSSMFKDEVDHLMPSTTDITRFIFLQARFELAAESQKRLKRQNSIPSMNPSTFARIIHILHLCKGYSSIADFMVRALRVNENQEILRIIIDFLRCHADVWTAMDRWDVIVDALIERFHRLDRKDIYHPRLPRLIIDLAKQGRAKEEDAEEMRSYIDYHEKAWYQSMGTPSEASRSMPELRRAFLDGDIGLAKRLGQDMYVRHGPYPGWAKIWWGTIVDCLRGLSVAMDDTEGVLSAVIAHVDQVCGFAAFTIDIVVSQWLDTVTQRYDMFSAVSPIRQVFLMLVTRRRLSTSVILEKLVYGLWKQLSTVVLSSRPGLNSNQLQAIDTTVILVQQLLLTKPPNTLIPPQCTQESLIAQASRAQVFSNHNIPSFIRHLPFLVVLGSVGVPDKTKDQINLFFRDLATIPEFKTAAFRHLGLLKDAFLSSNWGKANPAVETGMIETLKAIMSEGPPSKGSIPSLNTGARLSAWRWTSVVLEMRVEIKRLVARIDEVGTRDALRKLLQDNLHGELTADNAELLCEVLKGIDPIVVLEILTVGLDRLSALLSRMIEETSSDPDKQIDLVLKIICNSGAADMAMSDNVVIAARHRVLENITTSLQAVEVNVDEAGHLLRAAMKLLRFVLSLNVTETQALATARPVHLKLIVALLRILTVLHDADRTQMADMLVHVMDSAPSSARPAIHLALIAESGTAGLQAALSETPTLADLLPISSPFRRYMNIHATNNGSSTIHSFDDRPWELFEHMAPLPPRRKHGEQFLALKGYQDTSSIPMTLFDPLIKRDALPGRLPAEVEVEGELRWQDLASERNLGNGLAGEPLAARQAATLLYAGPDISAFIPDGSLHPTSDTGSPRNLPRRMSTRIASASASTSRNQPGTSRDPISIDDEDGDEDEDNSDDSDDLEVIQPPPKRPRTGSKSTAASKRPVTGGKAPARKTVGGKNVGGKHVGGKNVARKTSGKAVKGRK